MKGKFLEVLHSESNNVYCFVSRLPVPKLYDVRLSINTSPKWTVLSADDLNEGSPLEMCSFLVSVLRADCLVILAFFNFIKPPNLWLFWQASAMSRPL